MAHRASLAALLLPMMFGVSPTSLRAEVLHIFSGSDGSSPSGAVVRDAGGALYGVTFFGGSGVQSPEGLVYKLAPPATGSKTWVEQVLHQFPANANDGSNPTGSLLSGPAGVFFGTTQDGQGSSANGTIFKLSPPTDGSSTWSEKILHAFGSSDRGPTGSLIADASGALYGVSSGNSTDGFGTVFKLAPPIAGQTQWTYQSLYNFSSGLDGSDPNGTLAMDAAGNLYGATTSGGAYGLIGNFYGYGTIFQLTPPAAGQTAWTKTILLNFTNGTDGSNPIGGLSMNSAGVIYGTTTDPFCESQCGTVFSLLPPAATGGTWTYDLIYSFHFSDGATPEAPPVSDAAGNLYGTTYVGGIVSRSCSDSGCGVFYKLIRPTAGVGPWTETFSAPHNRQPPSNPLNGLLLGRDGYIYSATAYGGQPTGFGYGTVARSRQ